MKRATMTFVDDLKEDCYPLQVKVVDGDFEDAFKRFRTLFQKERIIGQLKEKQAYEKPSEKKRRKEREARERKLMMEARARMIASGEWDRRQKKREQKRQQRLENRVRRQEQYEE